MTAPMAILLASHYMTPVLILFSSQQQFPYQLYHPSWFHLLFSFNSCMLQPLSNGIVPQQFAIDQKQILPTHISCYLQKLIAPFEHQFVIYLFFNLRPNAAPPFKCSGDFVVSPNSFRWSTTSFVNTFITVASLVLLPFINTVFRTATNIFSAALSLYPNWVRQ